MISQQEYDNLYSAAERALHVDKVAYEVSSYLALPQLAAFSMAARDFQDTDRARLAAPRGNPDKRRRLRERLRPDER